MWVPKVYVGLMAEVLILLMCVPKVYVVFGLTHFILLCVDYSLGLSVYEMIMWVFL
jgi:hypothetical protein